MQKDNKQIIKRKEDVMGRDVENKINPITFFYVIDYIFQIFFGYLRLVYDIHAKT